MLILGFDDKQIQKILDSYNEGWELLCTRNDEIGVFKSTWGEIREFNKSEISELILDSERDRWGIKYDF